MLDRLWVLILILEHSEGTGLLILKVSSKMLKSKGKLAGSHWRAFEKCMWKCIFSSNFDILQISDIIFLSLLWHLAGRNNFSQ